MVCLLVIPFCGLSLIKSEILIKVVKGESRLKRLVVEDQFQNTVNTFVIEHFSNNNYDMIEHK